MAFKINEGDYCDTGTMICRAERNKVDDRWFHVGCHVVNSHGQFVDGGGRGQQCVLRIVEVRDVLPFTLRAGGKYATVKPDGTAGPVLTLTNYSMTGGAGKIIPFLGSITGTVADYYVTDAGRCEPVLDDLSPVRIVAEHIEQPSLAERLENLCQRILGGGDKALNAEFDECIAAAKKLEGAK